MDALSDVLRAIRLSGSLFFRVELGAPFAVVSTTPDDLQRDFGHGADHLLPFHMVTGGRIWFDVAGEGPVELGPEDLIVLPRGNLHCLVDRPGSGPPVPVGRLGHEVSGKTLRHGGGGETSRALCGFFRCNGKLFNPLLEALPAVMVVRRDPARTPWLCATLERAFSEALEDRPGTAALVERLTELLFVEVVQAWMREHEPPGWLAGLSDPIVGGALARMHAEPAHPWTVDQLARRVGASRTEMAGRFRATIGMSVIRYLTRWRMELAADRLLSTDRSVAEIAAEVGYESEASLNRAFKRHAGVPPASWRRAAAASRSPGAYGAGTP